MRLVRFIAHAGVASRRAADALIRGGEVSVNGAVVRDPALDVTPSDRVTFRGEVLEPEPREAWLVNKPLDVISTAKEPGSRRAVTELVPSERRLYPVGRLDADSTGLVLLTNDGDLANLLTHPRYEVPKTYRCALSRPPSDDDLTRLRNGVELDDGLTAPAAVERVGEREITIEIREGRNRQIRRMAEAVGNQVESLRRTALGPLELGSLEPGESRKLDARELASLWDYASEMNERAKR